MGSLALVASHTVNGVSKLHSELLKERVFKVCTFYIFPAIDAMFHSLCSMEYNVFGTDVVRISMIYFLTSSKTRQMVLLRSTSLYQITLSQQFLSEPPETIYNTND
jgi:hypothetical protein